VRRRIGDGRSIMAVVKANAYGHGMIEVARKALRCEADCLGVAIVEEGIALRENGIASPIMVFTAPFSDQLELFLQYNLELTLCSIEIARLLDSLARGVGRKGIVHVKVDTGMGRIGVPFRDAGEFISRLIELKSIELKGLYTHFATADERNKDFAILQLARFRDVIHRVHDLGIKIPLKHCANSAAILDLPDSYFDMVRPGSITYGSYPSHETSESIELEPVLSLKSRVLFIKEVPKGTPISYGRKYYTRKPTRIVSVPYGYADGFSRLLANKAEALINGMRFPVVGTVCMDQVMIDVGPDSNVEIGDDVVFIGQSGKERITAWDIADKIGTISYEVVCSISSRVPRHFVSSERDTDDSIGSA
jgi:alanine racemase